MDLPTNLKGIDWLRRHFKNHRIHTVNFPGDPYPIHIDATFTPIREGLIINNPQRKLPKDQKKLFEKNGWKIIDQHNQLTIHHHLYVIHLYGYL